VPEAEQPANSPKELTSVTTQSQASRQPSWWELVFSRQHRFFSISQIVAALLIGWWWPHLPSPGYAVAVIAVLAAAMSIHTDMPGPQKAIWMVLIGAFLLIEFRAIKKDREENDKLQAGIRQEERNSFKSVLDKEAQNLKDILANQQTNFSGTTDQLLQAQRDERRQFSGVLEKQLACLTMRNSWPSR
jgi:hypothetical protein